MMRSILTILIVSFLTGFGFSQSSKNLFKPISKNLAARTDLKRTAVPKVFSTYRLDFQAFENAVRLAPQEFTAVARQKNCRVVLPNPDGTFETFAIWKTGIMHPDLAAKFPQIMTFAGESIESPGKTLCLIVSMHGVKAAICNPDLSFDYVESMYKLNTEFYQSYHRADYPFENEVNLPGSVVESESEILNDEEMFVPENKSVERGPLLEPVSVKIFRYAVSCTGEYAQDNGGTLAAVLAKVVEHSAQVSANFERDIDIRLQLVANNEQLIFLDPATDPFVGQVGDYMSQNPAVLNAKLTIAGYDIGHNYCRYTGGAAAGISGGTTCQNSKGAGCSSGSGDYGAGFIGVIGQEVGHNLSGGHTWNRCGDTGGRNGLTAFEPGSGSTIMSYGGACGTDNVISGTTQADLYYHAGSIDEIGKFAKSVGCGTKQTVANIHPVVTLPYQNNFFIPISTPFELDGSASDEDGDALTYCWEQMDAGPEVPLESPAGSCATFRSRPAGLKTNRYCPPLITVITNGFSLADQLPTYTRDMTFRLTARDNKLNGGGVGWADVEFKATDLAGPFLVQSPNLATDVWHVGEYVNVKWDVANTNNAPVNCKKVNIRLSKDAGQTYPITLASNVENDGSQYILVPNELASAARVRIDGADNIFFDISDKNFKILAPTAPALSLGLSTDGGQVCLPNKFTTEVISAGVLGFNSPVELLLLNLPPGAKKHFFKDIITPGENSILEIDLTEVTTEGVFTIEMLGIAGTDTIRRPITLTLVSNDFSNLALVSPADGSTGLIQSQTLTFDKVPDANLYDIEIGTSAAFLPDSLFASQSNMVGSSFVLTNQLEKSTGYFWRVRPKNECGTHEWTEPFFFSTLVENCSQVQANDLPKVLTANAVSAIESELFVNTPGTVSDVNIKSLKGFHNAFKDLDVELVSPAGTVVPIFKNKCGTISVSFNLAFDNQAPNAFSCPPGNSGVFVKPTGNLGTFTGESVTGKWLLKVKDVNPGGGGSIEGFRLEFCASASLNPPFLVKNVVMPIEQGKDKLVSPDLLLVEDANNSHSQLIYTLLAIPKFGRLEFNGAAVQQGARFSQQDLDEGKLRYFDLGNNLNPDSFKFIVEDGEGGWLGSTKFIIQPFTVGTSEAEGKIGFSVFPNPTSEKVSVFFENSVKSDTRVAIFSIAGQLMNSEILGGGEQFISLEMKELPQGIYFLSVENQEGRGVQKVVKN